MREGQHNIIRVTCALIESEQGVLVVQRSNRMKLPLKWEFPGGKLEPDESEEHCIKREIREELELQISIGERLTSSIYHYPDFSIELIPFIAKHENGELKLTEHRTYKVLKKHELLDLDWAEADIPIVKEYMAL